MRIATASVRTGFAMTVFCKKCGGTGRRRHRPPRMVARSACVRADVGIGPYGSATRGAMGGRPQGSPLRKRYKGCNGRATARVAPTKSVVGADAPVRPWAFLGCVMRRGEGSPPYIILCYFVVRGGGDASGLSPVNRAGECPALAMEFLLLTYSDRRSSRR